MDDPANTTPSPGGAGGNVPRNPPGSAGESGSYKAPAGGGVTPLNPTGQSDRRPLPDNDVTREVFESAEQQRKARIAEGKPENIDEEREAADDKE